MTKNNDYLSYEGQCLIAMPSMEDNRFVKTLIYICAHSKDGAMGIVINKQAQNFNIEDLLAILQEEKDPKKSNQKNKKQFIANINVHHGGPVEPHRGFVLHSSDYNIKDLSLKIDKDIFMTASIDILKAIYHGKGPKEALFALGYAGWGPGQLETEILQNGWLSVKVSKDILFHTNSDEKYDAALKTLGIDYTQLAHSAGHS